MRKAVIITAFAALLLAMAASASAQYLPTHGGVCDSLCGANPLCAGKSPGDACGFGWCTGGCDCQFPTCGTADDSYNCCGIAGGEWLRSGERGEVEVNKGFERKTTIKEGQEKRIFKEVVANAMEISDESVTLLLLDGTSTEIVVLTEENSADIGGFRIEVDEFDDDKVKIKATKLTGPDTAERKDAGLAQKYQSFACSATTAERIARFKECATAGCNDDPADEALCDSPTDCVFNGVCYSDADILADELFGGDLRQLWDSPYRDEVFADVDGDERPEVCDPGEWHDSEGTLEGVVRNATGEVQEGVTVTILGTGSSNLTDASGFYTISGVEAGTYDVSANHPDPAYSIASSLGVELVPYGTTTEDITVTLPSDGCNDDCTMADGLCHAECQGKGLCSYVSPETQSACDNAAPGIIDDPNNPGQQILCCTGAAFTPAKANVDVCGENVVSLKKPVLFKGKLVNMVVTVFDAGECEE